MDHSKGGIRPGSPSVSAGCRLNRQQIVPAHQHSSSPQILGKKRQTSKSRTFTNEYTQADVFSDVAWKIRMLKLATVLWLSVRLQDA